MNRSELEQTLRQMSHEEFTAFVKDFGGNHKTPDTVIRNYVDHPEWEPRLCQLLGFLTEEERRTRAVLESAVASKWSAIAAAVSAIIAFLVLLLAFAFAKGCHTKAQPVAPADVVPPAASQPSVPGG